MGTVRQVIIGLFSVAFLLGGIGMVTPLGSEAEAKLPYNLQAVPFGESQSTYPPILVKSKKKGDDDGDKDDRDVGRRAFVGLWQAIDSLDGSTQFLSITCSSRRACDVRLNDTAFTLSCPNEIGFAQGVGSIKRHVLTVDLTLNCTGTGVVLGPQPNDFVLDRKNGTLTNLNSDNDNDPVPVDNVFHRISK